MKSGFLLLLLTGAFHLTAQEICTNGMDDDGDGLIDLQDPECACTGLYPWEPESNLPNPSFEEKSCCPASFSMMNCVKDWQKGTIATTDFLHTCDFVMPAVLEADLLPFPSDSGAVGMIFSNMWVEYVGTCMATPLFAGRTYRLAFQIASVPLTNFGETCNNGVIYYPDIDLAVWGNPDCELPVTTQGCPGQADSLWMILGKSTYHPESTWGTFSITFTPTSDINGLMIGPTCELPSTGYNGSPCYAYFILDALVLESTEASYQINISDNGWTDSDKYALFAEAGDTSGTWQWYFEGVAIEGQTAADFSFKTNNYQPGTYQVTYTKNGLCIQDSFHIDLPPPQAMIGGQKVSQDTFYFVNRSKYALDYIWHFGDGETSTEKEPLFHQYPGPGSYNGYLVAINHCCSDTVYFSAPIYQPPYLLHSDLIPHYCDSSGTIILDILSSTPFTCEWSTGQITDKPTLTDLLPGQYSVQLTNQNGQSLFGQFTIDSSSTGFQGMVYIETVPTCQTPPTGIIMLVSSDSDSVYTYHWSHDPDLDSSIAANLLPGEYQVTLTDSYGCQKEITIHLPDQGPIIESLMVGSPLCPGELSGTLDVLISGPNGPFNIVVLNLSTSMFKSPPYQLDRGDYRIDIADSSGCFTTHEFNVVDPPTMQIEFLIGLDMDGQPTILSPKVSQGQPPYSFLWSDGSTASSRSDLTPGIYQVTVTDDLGCTRIKEIKFGLPGGGAIGNNGLQIEVTPASGELRLSTSGMVGSSTKVDIVDLQGRLIRSAWMRSGPAESLTIQLHSGLYWLHIQTENGEVFSRSVFIP